MWEVMFWPMVACLVLPGILVYFGLHVVRREIIFVDLALAQIAALGTCLGLLFHFELQSTASYWMSLGFTLVGATLFSLARSDRRRVPLEAIIGISYVMAAAGSVLILSRAPEGDEQLKNMLVGSILLVTPAEVGKSLLLFGVVAAFHIAFRRQFLAISFDPPESRPNGLALKWWDFLFYASFGIVVTSFVRVAGVLLVFTYLIVPAVCSLLLARRLRSQLAVGLALSGVGGVLGLLLSFHGDLPPGAAIVCTFGAILVLAASVSTLKRRAGVNGQPKQDQ